jgi:DNA-binding SARP family transcriptional activator
MVAVKLLGAFSVAVSGVERSSDHLDRAGRVLAWLALNPGMHDRGTVAARLWPDVRDDSARASLRSGLWELRRLLDEAAGEVLIATRDQIGLSESVVVDVLRGRAEAAAGHDEEAFAIAAPELLPGVAEEWADAAREDHHRFLIELLGRLADAAAGRGEHGRAIELARRRAALDPLSEELHRHLLLRLVEAGDRASALAEYGRMRRTLYETLGVGPSRTTQELVAELRAAPAHEAGGLPTRLRRMELQPFLGRGAELELLGRAWRRALRGGRPQLALVSGEPGIGKTRLAARFAAIVDEGEGTVLYGGAFEDSLAPLAPFAEALAAGDGEDPGGAASFDGFAREMELRTGGRAALLVLDDMQWSDNLTGSLLGHLLRTPAADRLMVLCAYRDAELAGSALERVLPSLRRECEVAELTLGGLDDDELRALIEEAEETRGVSIHASVIRRRTAGNPLFARELAREVASGAALEEAVPAAVGELIARRTERLSDRGEALAAAAVLGEAFSPQVVSIALGRAVADCLDEAAAAKLLEATDRGLRFVHALVRTAVYARLGPAKRADLHRRAAEALVAVRAGDAWPDLAEIARHRLAAAGGAGDPALAVETALNAAGRAADAAAYDQAVELYTRALPLVAPGDERLRRVLVVRRASAFQLLTHAVIDARQVIG